MPIKGSPREGLPRGTWLRALFVLSSLLLPVASFGQRVQVESELIAEIRQAVPGTQGTEGYRFVPAKVLSQGAVVYYTVRVRNPTTAYARSVVVVQKIPDNTSYVAGSAAGPAVDVTLSADGGRSFTAEKKIATRKADEPATVPYTHIRYRFRNAIAPGATALVRFRAIFR